jgi:hypothetical protein
MFSVLQVLTVILVAVAMALPLGHALELLAKMWLDKETYYTMQPSIIRGSPLVEASTILAVRFQQ